MYIFRKTSTRSPSSSRGPSLNDLIVEAGYGHVIFEDDHQREKFVALMRRPISATRFIDHDALDALGLKRAMKRMLKRSGCPGLYTMCENTYRCLTLEFLSSYFYDEDEPAVNFRLFGDWHCFYPEEWGKLLGCRSTGYTTTIDPRDGTEILWTVLTGLEREGSNWKFRAHLIHHPVIRLWCRLVSSIYFGRPEPTNMKREETQMLFSYLNADGGDRFEVNIGHFVAKHLEAVACGAINHIMVGGLITHFAKSIFERVDESVLDLVPGSPTGEPLTLNIQAISRLHYLKTIEPGSWWWKVGNTRLVRLPEDGPVQKVKPVAPFPSGTIDYSYYLIDPTDRYHGSPIGGGGDEEGTTQAGVNIIPPMGDYSNFQHYPFQQGPYRPDGLDPFRLPSTFATYPPFNEPTTWNQPTRDAMLMGLCNQMHQAHLDNSLGSHNIYAYHANQGHFPEGILHPSYYVPRPATPDDNAAYSGTGQADRHSHYTDRSGSFLASQQSNQYEGDDNDTASETEANSPSSSDS